MSARTRGRRRAPAVPEFHPGQLLDWTGPWHWGGIELPCRYCGMDTPLRDSKRQPAHKVCAESALAQQQAEAADAYQQNGPLTT